MRAMRILLLVLLLLLPGATAASADDGPGFRRTTPRAPLTVTAEELWFGVPAGRAWGLESRLIPLGAHRSVALDLAVRDPAVREGFVRIAWYAREDGRPRQLAVDDSPAVAAGVERRVVLRLEPPEGAVAFRVRVLARVAPGEPGAGAGALAVARIRIDGSGARPALTRSLAASR